MKFIKTFIFQLFFLFIGQHAANADNVQTPLNVGESQAVLLEELDQLRGQGGISDITIVNNQDLDATLNNNSAINNINGFNLIDHGAFTEASGIISVIQNTGNNVIIQESTIINFTITP